MATPQVTFGCSFSEEGSWDVAEFARRAEALGFDRVTTGEHIMDGNPPRPTLLGIPAMAVNYAELVQSPGEFLPVIATFLGKEESAPLIEKMKTCVEPALYRARC